MTMKREIEFRGRTAKGEWVYGDLLNLHNGDKYIVNNKFGACIDDKGNFINTESPFVCKVIPETVGQYVGITDKNGKKIFENDIVKVSTYAYGLSEKNGQVKFENGEYIVMLPSIIKGKFATHRLNLKKEECREMGFTITITYEYEVIGTVFDKESDNGD